MSLYLIASYIIFNNKIVFIIDDLVNIHNCYQLCSTNMITSIYISQLKIL
jgi:hypothetical protein